MPPKSSNQQNVHISGDGNTANVVGRDFVNSRPSRVPTPTADKPTERPVQQLCAVFATALPVEFNAVRAHLSQIHEVEHDKGTLYDAGVFTSNARSWQVAIVQTGQGNPRAALEVERAIEHFSPRFVFFIGVAGGLKDVTLGDVVIASKVYGYESGKSADEYYPRFDFGESAYRLQQRAASVVRNGDWRARVRGTATSAAVRLPQALIGPIASGEQVIASSKAALYQFVRTHCSDALAVEMESFGFFRAMHANGDVQGLVVRGISDTIDGKAEADASGSQERAANHAAAFAFEVLAQISA